MNFVYNCHISGPFFFVIMYIYLGRTFMKIIIFRIVGNPRNQWTISPLVSSHQVEWRLPGIEGHMKQGWSVKRAIYFWTITEWKEKFEIYSSKLSSK